MAVGQGAGGACARPGQAHLAEDGGPTAPQLMAVDLHAAVAQGPARRDGLLEIARVLEARRHVNGLHGKLASVGPDLRRDLLVLDKRFRFQLREEGGLAGGAQELRRGGPLQLRRRPAAPTAQGMARPQAHQLVAHNRHRRIFGRPLALDEAVGGLPLRDLEHALQPT